MYLSKYAWWTIISLLVYVSFGISLGKPVVSLDSPPPETLRKYEPVLADFWEPHCGLDSRSSDADALGITEPNIGMLIPHSKLLWISQLYFSCPLTNGGCCFLSDDNTIWMHQFSFRSSLTNDTIEVLICKELVASLVQGVGCAAVVSFFLFCRFVIRISKWYELCITHWNCLLLLY